MYPMRNSLPEHVRAQSNEILNKHLAAAIDLHAQLKQAHWNVRVPAFIAIHELFDRISVEVKAMSDLIAERVAGLGGTARGTIQLASERSFLAPICSRSGLSKPIFRLWPHSGARRGRRSMEQSPLETRTPQTFSSASHALSISSYGWLSRTMSRSERLRRGLDKIDAPASTDEAYTTHSQEQGAAKRLRRSIANWVNEGGAGGEVR